MNEVAKQSERQTGWIRLSFHWKKRKRKLTPTFKCDPDQITHKLSHMCYWLIDYRFSSKLSMSHTLRDRERIHSVAIYGDEPFTSVCNHPPPQPFHWWKRKIYAFIHKKSVWVCVSQGHKKTWSSSVLGAEPRPFPAPRGFSLSHTHAQSCGHIWAMLWSSFS